jgi:hypothetical protein
LQNSDIHHIFERKFGGLFQETEQFNYSDNLAVALCIHPADQDPHREAHKFDTKEVYYWRAEDGTIRQGTITQIPEGAEVLRPALYKKDENGQYNPVIDYNTLLVTSSGKRIAYPEIRGNNGQREYFSQQPKTLQTPNLVNNNGGNER